MAQILTLLKSRFLPSALIKMGACSGADVFVVIDTLVCRLNAAVLHFCCFRTQIKWGFWSQSVANYHTS